MRLRHAFAILSHPRIYLRGRKEAHDSVGMTYCGNPENMKSVAYDMGREHGAMRRDKEYRKQVKAFQKAEDEFIDFIRRGR
jgi:hypothetical protein